MIKINNWNTVLIYQISTFPKTRQIEIKDVTKLSNWDDTDQNEVVLRPNCDRTKQCSATWGIDSLNTSMNSILCWKMATYLDSLGMSLPLQTAFIEHTKLFKAYFLKLRIKISNLLEQLRSTCKLTHGSMDRIWLWDMILSFWIELSTLLWSRTTPLFLQICVHRYSGGIHRGLQWHCKCQRTHQNGRVQAS